MAFHLSSCQQNTHQQPPVLECKLVSSFDEYPDSTFFKDVYRVEAVNDRLYMLDQWRGDVAVFDMETDCFYTVGAKGQGPKELARATDFYVQDDTLAILDGAALSLKLFYGKEYVRSLNVPSGKELRFIVDEEKVYLPCQDKETVYLKLPKAWQRDQLKDVELAGEYLDITDEEGMNFSRNERHLVKGEGCLYAICPSHPMVQKYDL